jgi:hypothetical protein
MGNGAGKADRKMGCHFIFLFSIFLSAFVARLRLCGAGFFALFVAGQRLFLG